MILADTVGFIRHLPHDLVEAFHATLEEVSEADLLLHVVDGQDINRDSHIEQVNQVLEAIHARAVPRILVYNKIDLNTEIQPKIDRDEFGQIRRVFLSAQTGAGLAALASAIGEMLGRNMISREVILGPGQAKLRAEFYSREAVMSERIDEEGNCHLQIRMPQGDLDQLLINHKRRPAH